MLVIGTDDLNLVRVEIERSKVVALDCETRPREGFAISGLDVRPHDGAYESTRSRLAGVALATSKDTGFYLPLQHNENNADIPVTDVFAFFRWLGLLIQRREVLACFWNAAFDQCMLAKLLGIEHWDHTMFADGEVLDKFARPRAYTHGLKETIKAVFGHEMPAFSAPRMPYTVPQFHDHALVRPLPATFLDFGARDPKDCEPYAVSDTTNTLRYIVSISALPQLERYAEVCAIEHDFVTPVRALAVTQLGYDRTAMRELADECQHERDTTAAALAELGIAKPSSNPQVLTWLRDRGFREASCDKHALKRAPEALQPAASLIQRYRKAAVHCASYLATPLSGDSQTELCGSFRAWGAKSGRMSAGPAKSRRKGDIHVAASFLPHGQPKDARFRGLFCARPGYLLVGADWISQEYRAAAALSGAKTWIATFAHADLTQQDVHAATARGVFPRYDLVDDAQRQQWRAVGKTLNFAVLYGAAAPRVAEMLSIAESEAQQHIDRFFASEPAIPAFRDKVIELASRTGIVHTLRGRPIAVRGKELTGGSEDEPPVHACLNYLIQGSCADLLREAALTIFKHEATRIKIMGGDDTVRFVLAVHDELLFEVVEHEAYAFAERLRGHMEGCCPREWPVKLPVDLKIGKRWTK